MGSAVLKQPDGKFAVLSSVVDSFVMWHATEEDVYEYFRERAIENADRATKSAIARAIGEAPQIAMVPTWEEAVEIHNECCPEDPWTPEEETQ